MLKPFWTCAIALLLPIGAGWAHVPYIEGKDYSVSTAFKVEKIIQSKAFYAYLDKGDVDEFVMHVEEPTPIYVHMLIPFCKEYAAYATRYALTGPGLPKPTMPLPIELPSDHGAIVWDPHYDDWSERPFMYEMFSDRQYFESTRYRYDAEQSGEYRLVVWHPDGTPGDYIAILGRTENFSLADMQLAYVNTPIIRAHAEMKGKCTYKGDFSQWFADNDD